MDINMYSGLPVFVSNSLPFRKTYKASDIATKEEVNILSDEWVNAFEMDGVLYVSKLVFDKIAHNKIKYASAKTT